MASPLEALPVELFRSIIEELPPASVWGLRRVSKHFNIQLTSEAVVENALERHNTHDPTDGIPGDRFKLLQANHSGIPRSVAHITFNRRGDGADLPRPILKGKYILSTTLTSFIHLTDLVTGLTVSWHSDIGDYIRGIALTTKFAAWAEQTEVAWRFLDAEDTHNASVAGEVVGITGNEYMLAVHYNGQLALIDTRTAAMRNITLTGQKYTPFTELALDEDYCLVLRNLRADIRMPGESRFCIITQVDLRTSKQAQYSLDTNKDVCYLQSFYFVPSGRAGEWAIVSDENPGSGLFGTLRPGQDHKWSPISQHTILCWKDFTLTRYRAWEGFDVLNIGNSGALVNRGKHHYYRVLIAFINESFLVTMNAAEGDVELTVFSFHDSSEMDQFQPLPIEPTLRRSGGTYYVQSTKSLDSNDIW